VDVTLDPRTGSAVGKPVSLFQDGSRRFTPSLTADGNFLTYVRSETDGYAIRVLDRRTKTERTVHQQRNELRARISPDGSTIGYNTRIDEKETDIYIVSAKGGASRKICDHCGLFYDWTPDGTGMVYRAGTPMRFWKFDIASGQSEEILSHPKYHVHAGVYSPDQRWLALHLAPSDGPSHIFVTPVRDGKGAPESEWIPVFTQPGYNSRPWWSADGKTLYFSSDAAGPRAIYGQRLDPLSRKPLGSPWVVYVPASSAETVNNGHRVGVGFAAGHLILGVSEFRGNIWLAE
jgi:Tol biopolymer transport system component